MLDSLVAIEAIDPNLEKASYDPDVPSSSVSWSSPRKGNEHKESGELRALSPELGDAIEGVLAAPKEKPGDGRGPGIGEETVRDVIA